MRHACKAFNAHARLTADGDVWTTIAICSAVRKGSVISGATSAARSHRQLHQRCRGGRLLPDALNDRGCDRGSHGTTSATPKGSAIPLGHELCAGLASGGRGELSEERSWGERRREATVMSCSAQRPHMNVELVSQNLKRQSIMRWPFRPQRLRLVDDGPWPSPGIPGAECFDGDTEGLCALHLGQAELCSNFPQRRNGTSHRSRRCHRSVTGWKRMDCDESAVRGPSEMRQKPREVFQLVGSDPSR